MRDLRWWLEWPVGVVRVGVVFLVLATTVAVLLRYPSVLRELEDSASRNSALSYSDREIAGGNGLVVDQTAAYAARALIPEDDAFNVVVDPEYASGSDLTVDYVASYYRYFLMPRRLQETAPWVICYGCDLGAYGSSAEVVWKGSDDISIVKVER